MLNMRSVSPAGGSIFSTSAPMSRNSAHAAGPATQFATSTTRIPPSGAATTPSCPPTLPDSPGSRGRARVALQAAAPEPTRDPEQYHRDAADQGEIRGSESPRERLRRDGDCERDGHDRGE